MDRPFRSQIPTISSPNSSQCPSDIPQPPGRLPQQALMPASALVPEFGNSYIRPPWNLPRSHSGALTPYDGQPNLRKDLDNIMPPRRELPFRRSKTRKRKLSCRKFTGRIDKKMRKLSKTMVVETTTAPCLASTPLKSSDNLIPISQTPRNPEVAPAQELPLHDGHRRSPSRPLLVSVSTQTAGRDPGDSFNSQTSSTTTDAKGAPTRDYANLDVGQGTYNPLFSATVNLLGLYKDVINKYCQQHHQASAQCPPNETTTAEFATVYEIATMNMLHDEIDKHGTNLVGFVEMELRLGPDMIRLGRIASC